MTAAYRRTWLDRMLAVTATIGAAGILGAAVLLTVSLFWPYAPLARMEITVEGPVRAGSEIPVLLDYCKTSQRWVPREVRWTLVNVVLISIDGPKAALPVGCEPARPVAIPLSDHVAPGRYRLQADIIYSPWPWRDIIYTRRSQVFQIARE